VRSVNSFRLSTQVRPGNRNGAPVGAGAPAAGIASARGHRHLHGGCLRRHDQPGQEAGGRRDGAISARALHDAKGALGSGGAFRGDAGEDRGDRSEGVVEEKWELRVCN